MLDMQEEIQLPTQRGQAGARRLKILRIEQTDALPDALMPRHPRHREPMPIHSQLPAAPRRTLPPHHLELLAKLPAELHAEPPELAEVADLANLECWLEGKHVRLRSVGQMVTDETGNFYEVNGQQLRPLGELVGDEHGRIFEVQPASKTQPAAAATENLTENLNESASEQAARAAAIKDNYRVETPSQPVRSQLTQAETSPAYHKIIADPGLYLKLPWARVKNELAPQLKHSEKLRDDVLIECHAQIYEAHRTLPAAELAALELGDDLLASQLHPLTQAKAQMLGAPQLFKPTREPFETRAASRQIAAGQRVYRLWPLFDPTVERVSHSKPMAKSEATAATPRRQIPQQYLNPLQFKYSREEVLYDMKSVLGTLPPESSGLACWFLIYPMRALKAICTSIRSKGRMKKWRAMLKDREADLQLWAVTPPRGFSYNAAVRSWAEHTLGNAGYDAQPMLLEWEIFWRRKGWN